MKTNSWNLKIPQHEKKKYRPQPPIFGGSMLIFGGVKIHENQSRTPIYRGPPHHSTIGSQVPGLQQQQENGMSQLGEMFYL